MKYYKYLIGLLAITALLWLVWPRQKAVRPLIVENKARLKQLEQSLKEYQQRQIADSMHIVLLEKRNDSLLKNRVMITQKIDKINEKIKNIRTQPRADESKLLDFFADIEADTTGIGR